MADYFFNVAFTNAKPHSNKRGRAADSLEEVASKKNPPVEVQNSFENLETDNIEIDEDQNPTVKTTPKNKSTPPPLWMTYDKDSCQDTMKEISNLTNNNVKFNVSVQSGLIKVISKDTEMFRIIQA